MGKSNSRGFSLLEAIVALLILSVGAGALLQWTSQSLRHQARATEAERTERALRAAAALLDPVNPMSEPSGKRSSGGVSVSWEAALVDGPALSLEDTGLPGAFEVALYELEVRVSDGEAPPTSFRARKIGFRQFRAAEE